MALSVDRIDTGDDHVVELRGLDRSDLQVASVRLHVGDITDMHDFLPGDSNFGSEITLSALDVSTRLVTRETEQFLIPASREPALAAFLSLDEMTVALQRELNMTYVAPPRESTYQYPPITYNCSASQLNSTPYADQCCYTAPYTSSYWGYQRGYTYFIDPNGHTVLRWKSDYGACKNADGTSCSGNACFYGPNGYAKPVVNGGGNTPYPNMKIRTVVYLGSQGCIDQADTSAPEFSGLYGTFASGQGCATTPQSTRWDY